MKNWSVFLFVSILMLTATSAGPLDGKWDFKAESSDGQVFELILSLWEADGELKGTLGNYEGDIPLDASGQAHVVYRVNDGGRSGPIQPFSQIALQ